MITASVQRVFKMLITPTQISRQLCLLIYLQLLEIIAINAPLPSAIIFAIPLLPHKKAKSTRAAPLRPPWGAKRHQQSSSSGCAAAQPLPYSALLKVPAAFQLTQRGNKICSAIRGSHTLEITAVCIMNYLTRFTTRG